MSTCTGPGCGVEWACDMQHGLVDGRCDECRVMAEAASNLNVKQVHAILRCVDPPHDQGLRLRYRVGVLDAMPWKVPS